jgi:hypothetical protein
MHGISVLFPVIAHHETREEQAAEGGGFEPARRLAAPSGSQVFAQACERGDCLSVYSHVLPGMQGDGVAKIDSARRAAIPRQDSD